MELQTTQEQLDIEKKKNPRKNGILRNALKSYNKLR
jgi:hypothetical protein